jgi:23S rRNA (guanosine2251-2'-O)-methyltransferase
MAGNSQRRGARRGAATKKGATVGSGGQRRRGLEGKGPTPPAEARTGHPAAKRAKAAAKAAGRGGGAGGAGGTAGLTGGSGAAGRGAAGRGAAGRGASGAAAGRSGGTPGRSGSAGRSGGAGGRSGAGGAGGRSGAGGRGAATGRGAGAGRGGGGAGRAARDRGVEAPELLAGRNPVVEALRASVPATAVYVALGIDVDDRVAEAVKRAGDRGVPLLEVGRGELDRMTGGTPHQGIAMQVPPYDYQHADDLLARAVHSKTTALVVALDGVTDPRNLGAIVRSAAAFGAHGVLVPERRSAAMTASAWRASAGTAARLPVARVTNLVRTLRAYKDAGLFVAGLDADGDMTLDDFEAAVDPLVLVVGSEGRGVSRLVADTCDLTISIPMPGPAESLNASVAAAVTLAETARRRRAQA